MAGKVKPVPEGFTSVTPHFTVKGAAKAIEFYKKAFGAQEVCRLPSPDGEMIMHAEVDINGARIMLNDEFTQFPGPRAPETLKGTSFCVHLYAEDCDALFNRAVEAGAEVVMPPMDMFWGDRYGKVKDPFGHEWGIATHIADLTPEEIGKAAAEAMGNC